MKRVIAFTLCALMVMFVLAGCGGVTPAVAADEQLRVTLIIPMPRNEIWGPASDGFEDACKALGIDPTVLVPGREHDPNEMNALVETAIAEKVDALITVCYNPEAQDIGFRKLDDAGIPFVLINSDSVNSNRLAFLGTGLSIGTIGGKAISDSMIGKPIHSVSALFTLTTPYFNDMKEKYLEELRKHPDGFTETVLLETGMTPITTLQAWTDALMTYPEINAGFNIGGFGGFCAARAIRELNRDPSEFCIIGMDDMAETMDAIRNGYLFGTLTQNFYRMGYEPVGWLQNFILEGKRPENVVNDSGTMLVTKENIETYKTDMRNPSAW